jgi:hypothetical protein
VALVHVGFVSRDYFRFDLLPDLVFPEYVVALRVLPLLRAGLDDEFLLLGGRRRIRVSDEFGFFDGRQVVLDDDLLGYLITTGLHRLRCPSGCSSEKRAILSN